MGGSVRRSRLAAERFNQVAATASPKSLSGAGEGNRTLVVSLEGFCSTIELHPPESGLKTPKLLAVDTSEEALTIPPTRTDPISQCLVEGEGFEPSKAEPSDLQSDPFDRSGTPPKN